MTAPRPVRRGRRIAPAFRWANRATACGAAPTRAFDFIAAGKPHRRPFFAKVSEQRGEIVDPLCHHMDEAALDLDGKNNGTVKTLYCGGDEVFLRLARSMEFLRFVVRSPLKCLQSGYFVLDLFYPTFGFFSRLSAASGRKT